MSRIPAGRYSEGELSDSPDSRVRKDTGDDISLSSSEDDQNSDALDIRPPQHQVIYKSKDRGGKRGRDHDRHNRSREHHSRDHKSRENKHLMKEERREESRKQEYRDRPKDPRKEDLRERLERERRIRRGGKSRDDREERKEAELKKRYSESRSRERRTERSRRESQVNEFEIRERSREERRRKERDIEAYHSISSPESEDSQIVPDEEDKEKSKIVVEEANESVSESSDEGEASSSSESSSEEEDDYADVKPSNGKHRTPPSEHGDHEHPDMKRRRNDDISADEEPMLVDEKDTTPPPPEVEAKEEFPPYLPAIMGCRSVNEFHCLNKIEEGTYGIVFRAQDKRTNEIVALKRLKMEREKEGFPITSLREVSTLLKAQHVNIVTVREIVVGSNMDSIFMVMDYVEHDLKSLMEELKKKKHSFMPGEVKCLLEQLLQGVAHLHDNWILHRDLKTSNILLSHSGILKIGDFGLAREYGSPLKAYTSIVVTLWYRAPELLLGVKEYSTPIDVWSVGCIFGELLTLEAIFQGKSEADQINKIFRELGTPNDNIWPGYSDLPYVKKAAYTNNPSSNLRKRFSARLSELGLDLLQKFLTYDPMKRITAEDALKHTYFKEAPMIVSPSMLPTWPAKSEGGHALRKAQSPRPPSGGRAYKQLGENDDVETGFHMGNTNADRHIAAMGAGFSLKF